LDLTDQQRQEGHKAQAGLRACLNRHYWGTSSETANSILIGSWGKDTRVRPPRDIDVLFLLPSQVYWQFEQRLGNRQSQLLQEAKTVLLRSYPRTTIRADGQVVVVPFSAVQIEVSLGFKCQDGSIIVCDTHNEGFYKRSTSLAEAADLDTIDTTLYGNVRNLVRMMKQWQRERNIELKSFQIERLAIEFLNSWTYRYRDVFYYDWMVRDFLAYLISRANGYVVMPGTAEIAPLGCDWLSRVQTAYRHSVEACNHEHDNYEALAGTSWQEIFGTAIPILVS
jgi:hypothetical protein